MRLEGVCGQKRAITQLETELAAERLAHAYLFVGPLGTGRGTLAKALFKTLNCLDPQNGLPCGKCASCKRFQANSHEDFLEIAPPTDSASSQIKVERIREALRTISFPPFGKGIRLILIRQAENLNPASANALLKTLEEPPSRNIIVLTVQDANAILPTLVSRCRRVNFLPLDQSLIVDELIKKGVDPDEAKLKAALSAGSLGKALEIDENRFVEELLSFKNQLLMNKDPLSDWQFAEDLVGGFKGARLDRAGLAQTLDLWGQFFRDQALVASQRSDKALLPLEHLGGFGLDPCVRGFSEIRKAQSRLLSNASPELTICVLLQSLRKLGPFAL